MQLRQEFSLCRVYKKSKCLRAFDRRPPGIEITRNPNLNIQAAPAQTADHLDQGVTTSNRNPQNMEGRTNSSSPEVHPQEAMALNPLNQNKVGLCQWPLIMKLFGIWIN
ncbi:unnamed protein product [Malus baccata var. baccata]